MPVASAFWLMASCGSLALTLRACPDGLHWGVVAGPVAYLGLMNLPFVALFHPIVTCARQHALYAMWAFRAICALALLRPTLSAAAREFVDGREQDCGSCA